MAADSLRLSKSINLAQASIKCNQSYLTIKDDKNQMQSLMQKNIKRY